jgi:hypothetical protein
MAASRKIHRKLRFATGGAGAGAALGTWLASLIGAPSAATYAIQIICAAVVALAAGYEAKAAPSDVPPPPQPPAS